MRVRGWSWRCRLASWRSLVPSLSRPLPWPFRDMNRVLLSLLSGPGGGAWWNRGESKAS